MAKEFVFVVYGPNSSGETVIHAAFQSKANADDSVDQYGQSATVAKVELKSKNESTGSKAKKSNKKAHSDDEEMVDDAPKATQKKNGTKSGRKTIPDGKPNALKGLKLLFTGTFERMDRETSNAIAEKFGATVLPANRIADVDYVVLGVKAGPKKLDEIQDNGLETLSETEFFEMIQGGAVGEKRGEESAPQPAKKKQKK